MPLAPYDIVIVPLNVARARLNDRIESLAPLGGQLLDNTQPFTQQVVNTAWRTLQEFLGDLGYAILRNETIFTNVPAAGSSDPALQAWMSYSGFFDGVNFSFSPFLPPDMMAPLDLWERPTGTQNPMTEMDRVLN